MNRRRKRPQKQSGNAPSRSGLLVTAVVALAVLGAAAFFILRPSQPAGLQGGLSDVADYVPLGDLAVSQQSVDLGRIPLDTDVTQVFRLRNIGQETLRLGKVSIKVLEGC